APTGSGRRGSQQAGTTGEGRKSLEVLRPSPLPEASPYRARAARPLPKGEGRARRILALILLIALGAAFVYGQRFRDFFFQNEPPPTELVVARWKYTAFGKFGGTGWSHNYPSSDQHFAQVISEATNIHVKNVYYRIVGIGSFQLPVRSRVRTRGVGINRG